MPTNKDLSRLKPADLSWTAFGVLTAINYLGHLDIEKMLDISTHDEQGFYFGLGELFAKDYLITTLEVTDNREYNVADMGIENPKPSKTSGYVYLMKAENGYYKIGRSKNVPARQKQLNREFPIKIEVIHQFWANDYIEREKDLHFLFQDKQQEGEWFALDQGDVETIMELKDEEPEPTS